MSCERKKNNLYLTCKSNKHLYLRFLFAAGLFDSFVLVNVFPAFVSAMLFVVFLLFVPESPRFLSSKGEVDEAKSILLKFKSIDRDVENDMQIWSGAYHRNGIFNALKQDLSIKQAVPLFGLFMFEQLIGAVSILFYLNKILTLTGKFRFDHTFHGGLSMWMEHTRLYFNFLFSFFLSHSFILTGWCCCESIVCGSCAESDYSPEVTAIICGSIFTFSVFISNFMKFEFTSIRSHLMWSSNLMGISLCLLGYYCHYQGTFGHIYTEDYRQLPWLCLGMFYFLYATGPYRLTHVYAEQIIPKKCYFSIRCLLSTTSWCLIYAITRMLPRLIDIIGVGWLFWFMAIMCTFMAAFVKLFVPDVKRLPEELKLVDSSESYSEAWVIFISTYAKMDAAINFIIDTIGTCMSACERVPV